MIKTITISNQERAGDSPTVIPAQIQALLPGIARLPKSALTADTLLVPNLRLLPPTRRLVVLVPAGDIDEHALARRVWQLASCSELDVLYLALSPDADQVFYQRRRLIGLAAQSAYPHMRTDISVRSGKNWAKALKQTIQSGDLLICLAENSSSGILQHKALSERLAASLGVPVYKFGDLPVKPTPHSQSWMKNVLAWGASITLLVVFFWMQLGIDRLTARPQATILLCLSVLVEVYCLWKINRWIG